MKWYEIVFLILLLIILSPFLLFIGVIWLIALPFITIRDYKEYKKSAYYKEFKITYARNVLYRPNYLFFNYAKETNLPIKYIKQEENALEYFIYNETIYIFPNFNELTYNEEKGCFEVVYRKYKEVNLYTLDEYFNKEKLLFKKEPKLPIKLLLSVHYLDLDTIDITKLPKTIRIVGSYDSAFKDEEDFLIKIPYNTKKLYDMMCENEKLGGKFELIDDELIRWTFNDVIYDIDASFDDNTINVYKNNVFKTHIAELDPDSYELYETICKIGEVGNMLVVRKTLGVTHVLYMGVKEDYKEEKRRIRLGKTYYFESKKE